MTLEDIFNAIATFDLTLPFKWVDALMGDGFLIYLGMLMFLAFVGQIIYMIVEYYFFPSEDSKKLKKAIEKEKNNGRRN